MPSPQHPVPRLLVRRWTQLFVGLFLYGIALALMIEAAVGLDPWTVFAQGADLQTGWGIGLVTVLIGALVLLLWIPLRQKPGIGTVLNVLLVGPALEVGLWAFEAPEELWARILIFGGGLAIAGAIDGPPMIDQPSQPGGGFVGALNAGIGETFDRAPVMISEQGR